MNTEIVTTETAPTPALQTPTPPDVTSASEAATEAVAVRVLPTVDVVDVGDAMLLVADLPGVPADAVQVQIHDGVLSLDALQAAPPDGAPIERKRFQRRFTLGETLDPESVEARLEHGVLRLTVGKTEKAQPRTIPIAVV